MSEYTYIKDAIKKLELEFAKSGRKIFKTAKLTIKPGYRPDLDVSPVFEDNQVTGYQTTGGKLRWYVEL